MEAFIICSSNNGGWQKLTSSIIPFPPQHSWIEIDIPSTTYWHRYVLRTERSQRRRRRRRRKMNQWKGNLLEDSPQRCSKHNHNRQEYVEDLGDYSEFKRGGNYDCSGGKWLLLLLRRPSAGAAARRIWWLINGPQVHSCHLPHWSVCFFSNGLLLPPNSPSTSSSQQRCSEEYGP